MPPATNTHLPSSPAIDTPQPAPDLHQWMTVDDVAELLKVSRSWVYEHSRARSRPREMRLPFVKFGKYVRFHPRAIAEFLDRQRRTCS